MLEKNVRHDGKKALTRKDILQYIKNKEFCLVSDTVVNNESRGTREGEIYTHINF